MISFRHRGPIALAAFVVSAGTATADVTPGQVWDAISGQLEGMGYALKVDTISKTDDSLVLGDVTYDMDLPDGGSIKIITRGMRFDADGQGGVNGDFSHLTMGLALANPKGEEVEAELALSTAGQEVVYSGTPEEIKSTFDWPLATLSLTALRVDGKPVEATGALTMHDLSGVYTYKTPADGSGPTIDSNMKMSRLDIDGQGTTTDDKPVNIKLTGAVLDIAATGTGQDLQMMLGGLPKSGASRVSYGAGNLDLAMDGEEGSMTLGAKTASGFAESSVANGHLIYGTGGTGFEISAAGSMIPLTGTVFKMATTESHLDLPMEASEDAQHFGLSFSLDGIELADQVWAMFDPQATLARDPATLSLNVSGDAVLKQSLAEVFENPEALQESPADLRSLVIDGLVMRVFGAELTAAGNAMFNPPSPMPVGTIDVHAKNITSVLQKLSALGLIDPSMGGMAQMMLGMYATPGDGPDTWDSHVEMTAEGGVLVNGQPMQ